MLFENLATQWTDGSIVKEQIPARPAGGPRSARDENAFTERELRVALRESRFAVRYGLL